MVISNSETPLYRIRVDENRPRNGLHNTFVRSSGSSSAKIYPNHENPQRFQSLHNTPDPLTRGSSSSLATIIEPNHENPQRSQRNGDLRNTDPLTRGSRSSLNRPPISINSRRSSPYRHPTLRRNDSLHNTSSILDDGSSFSSFSSFSSSSLNTIGENPQLHSYPSSSTALQSNGGLLSNTSFTTSPLTSGSPSNSSFTDSDRGL